MGQSEILSALHSATEILKTSSCDCFLGMVFPLISDEPILFRAMANVRNFMPFTSGSKNAHKSPFMLAQGQTHGLPWIQVMNVHNAFLFADDCF
jgi:hypothetical protein